MNEITIKEQLEIIVKPYLDEIKYITDTVAIINVTNAEAEKEAGDWRARLNGLTKKMDEKRSELKRPHLDANTLIDADFKPYLTACKKQLEIIDAKLIVFKRAESDRKTKWIEEQRKKELEVMAEKQKEMEKKAFADDNELALEIATNLETERVKLAMPCL